MGSGDQRPVIAVLCESTDQRPQHLGPVESRAEVRYTDEGGLGDALQGAQALFLWDFFSDAVEKVWSQAGSLEWIHVAAAGVDKLLFDDLVASDVVVTNARGVFDRPMAEFVLTSILARAKGLHTTYDLQREKRWEHRETHTVAGTTALVVGTGAIGRETARLLSALDVRVSGAGRTARSGDPDFGEVVASAELAAHVGSADHVVISAPLTEQTRGLVGAEVLAAMKPSAHLVNVGRGPIVDEDALVAALRGGELGAASLDVFVTEPLPQDHPLWTLPGVVVSPHMSGDAAGWLETLAHQFVDNAIRWLDGDSAHLVNVVDKRLGFVPSPRS
ncbi:MAG: D-2-hydroxyacid dehydrogenase [Nocardioidaceae bacterium]